MNEYLIKAIYYVLMTESINVTTISTISTIILICYKQIVLWKI